MAISLTPAAAQRVEKFLANRGKGIGLRLGIKTTGCSGMAYTLEFVDTMQAEDMAFESHGVKVIVDPKSLAYIDGTELDFAKEGLNEGFKFNNPNVKDECGCGIELYSVSDHYFSLLGFKPAFNIDLPTLEAHYRQLQSAAHPDRFVSASAAEQVQSLQTATKVNDAYRTLKSPANRAAYLLTLNGIHALAESNTSMPADFLMQQMEWREQLDDAKQAQDEVALEQLLLILQQAAIALQSELTVFFDEKNDLIAATETTRKLIFIDKVCADIDQALEALID